MNKNKFTQLSAKSVMAALLLMGLGKANAQEEKSEFSIYAGGTFSSIYYDLDQGQVDHGDGVQLGLKYAFYLNENWSIGLGAEYQTYNSTASFDYLTGNYNTTDFENDPFEFRYTTRSYNESQKLEYVNVPLTVQFETGDGITDFYVSAGVKAGFAMKGRYETKMDALTTSGYYPQYNAELFGPTFMGFGSFYQVNAGKQDLDTKIAWSGTLETGVKQYIGERSSCYIGVFVDYSFNSIADNKDENMINYPSDQMPVDLQFNSVINSSYSKDVRLIAYGIKLRFAFF